MQSILLEKLHLLIAENRRLERVLAKHRESRMVCCYHCGSLNLTLEGSFQSEGVEYHIWECMQCGLAQLEEHLAENQVKALEAANPFYQLPEPGEIEKHVSQHSFILDLIHQHQGGTRLLEIGCSLGFKLEAARRNGWEVQGVELSSHACSFVRSTFGIAVHEGTIESYMPERRFDAIVAWHVLEHVPSLSLFLSHVHTLLSPGGQFYLQVPSFALFRGLTPWTDFPENFNAVHYWYFTEASLSHQLMQNKLVPIAFSEDKQLRALTFVALRE